jgi:tetratricopeptide (TPR) repeat protein
MKKKSLIFLLILAFSTIFMSAYSQNQHKPSRQSSLEAFSRGDYEKAYNEFSDLLKIYPRDPLYRYYAGVSLVKLGRNASEAESLLSQALQNGGALKSLPADAEFYLGRAYQMNGNFNAAEGAYNAFTKEAGKKTAKDLDVPVYIQQCREGKGQVIESAMTTAKTTISGDETSHKNQLKSEQQLPENVDKELDKAIENQRIADSLTTVTTEMKAKVVGMSGEEKSTLKAEISGNQVAADSVQKVADQKYITAERMMNQDVKTEIEKTHSEVMKPDSSRKENVVRTTENKINSEVNVSGKAAQNQQVNQIRSGVFSSFEASKPVTDQAAKVEIDPITPEGLVYRIQIAVFRNPVAPSFFKGLSPVYGFTVPGTDKKIYYAGVFRRAADASKALLTVKGKGFKDAFVVAMTGSKTVSSDRAAVLEKEWGGKPLMNIPDIKAGQSEEIDTIPPTLVFRVEIARSDKPLKEDVVESYRRFAGKRGLDIITLPDGNITYLIGNFITFESASEYSNLLIRNGYKDAKVVSWIGRKEIPIETAKQLFDNLK